MGDMIPERCAEHLQHEEELYVRIEKIEDRLRELQDMIGKKADEAEMNRRLQELLDMVQSLQDSNIRHTEALAAIKEVLKAIESSQKDFKTEMERAREGREREFVSLNKNFVDLSSGFADLSKTMYSMNTLLMTMSNVVPPASAGPVEEEPEEEVKSVKRGLTAILRDYLRTPIGQGIVSLVILIIAVLLIAYSSDIVQAVIAAFAQKG